MCSVIYQFFHRERARHELSFKVFRRAMIICVYMKMVLNHAC